MKLHTAAAYLRKHSVLPEISSLTNVRLLLLETTFRTTLRTVVLQLQTTIYVSCGRCRKPILAQRNGSTCATCRTPAARCSIWYYCEMHSPNNKRLTPECLPQPPSGKVHALPLQHLLARRPPELLHAILRKDAVGFAPDTIGTLHV